MRIIPLKSMQYGSVMLRAGHYYALPEDLREEILAAGLAYREGEEPPLAQDDIDAMNREIDRLQAISKRVAVLRQSRGRANFKRDRELSVAAEALARAAALRIARKGN